MVVKRDNPLWVVHLKKKSNVSTVPPKPTSKTIDTKAYLMAKRFPI